MVAESTVLVHGGGDPGCLPAGAPARLVFLSRRERDVLALMAAGLTNAGIARQLWLTERTVEAHVSRIMVKLGLDAEGHFNRRVLAVLAYLDTVGTHGSDAGAPAPASR